MRRFGARLYFGLTILATIAPTNWNIQALIRISTGYALRMRAYKASRVAAWHYDHLV